jgi:serine/threonine-protein kinase
VALPLPLPQPPLATPETVKAVDPRPASRAQQKSITTGISPDWLDRPEGLIGAVLGGRYRITGVLGRGPMGIACEGESSRGRQVTIKLLPRPRELPVEHFAWQVRQTLALAHFDHANVTPITDFGSLDDGTAFVSRNRVPGVTLRTILRQGALPIRRSLAIARQLAAALAAAHAQDITHGRLKPENVLIQGDPGSGDLVKVVDFGMSGLPPNLRAVARSEDEAQRLWLGTELYLPAGAAGSSAAIDVYSLGVISFEMIAGQLPFPPEALRPGATREARRFVECSPPIQVPPAIDDIVLGMMHPDAAQHGLTAGRLVQLLDGLLGRASVVPAEPITSQLPGAPDLERQPSVEPPSRAATAPPPSVRSRGDAPPGAAFWPPAPPGAGSMSFPPLPQGYSASTIPPQVVDHEAAGHASSPSITRSQPPPLPGPRRQGSEAALLDAPSFPPPIPASDDDDDADADFRPSFIGRLRRLFVRPKRGSGF